VREITTLFFAQNINHINIIINFWENKVFCSEKKVILWLGYDGYIVLFIRFCLCCWVKIQGHVKHSSSNYLLPICIQFMFFPFIFSSNLYIILYSKLDFFFFWKFHTQFMEMMARQESFLSLFLILGMPIFY
jgi:hypothetical protein